MKRQNSDRVHATGVAPNYPGQPASSPETVGQRQVKEAVAICQRLLQLNNTLKAERVHILSAAAEQSRVAALERVRLTLVVFERYQKEAYLTAWSCFEQHVSPAAERLIRRRLNKFQDWNLVRESYQELIQDTRVRLFEALLGTTNAMEIRHLGRWCTATLIKLMARNIERLAQSKKLMALPIPGSLEADEGQVHEEPTNVESSLLGLSENDVLELLDRETVLAELQMCMQSLKPDIRTLIMLDQEGLSFAQIGAMTGKSPAMVCRGLKAAYASLRKRLNRRGIDAAPRTLL